MLGKVLLGTRMLVFGIAVLFTVTFGCFTINTDKNADLYTLPFFFISGQLKNLDGFSCLLVMLSKH